MSKYKAARKKADVTTPQMRPGVPCLVIVVGIVMALMVLVFLGMKNG